MSKIKLSENFIKDRVKFALTEDLYPYGDITSNLINNNKIIEAKIISNQKAVVAGLLFVKQSFKQINQKTKFIIKKKVGSTAKKNYLIPNIITLVTPDKSFLYSFGNKPCLIAIFVTSFS